MIDVELLAHCGKQLIQLRCVEHPLHRSLQPKNSLSSNDTPIGDLSDYSTLLESLNNLRYTILSHRNDQLLISRLPVEILTLICELTLPTASDPELTQPNNNRVLCAIKLTHVCTRWRSILISSPELWTNFRLITVAPKFVAACIQRSKTLPIHVSLAWENQDPDYELTSNGEDDGSVEDGNAVDKDGNGNAIGRDETCQTPSEGSVDGTSSHSTFSVFPDHNSRGHLWTTYIKEAQNYQYLIQQSHRIATLDISLLGSAEEDEDEDNPFACGLLAYPLPALQTLRLRSLPRSRGSIPRAVLDEHITTINSLLLENISLTQIVDLSLNITSLTLTSTSSDSIIDTGLFLRFLEKNQSLRSLTLQNYQFDPVPDSITVAQNNLRRLDFTRSLPPLRHVMLEPYSFFRIETPYQPFCSSAENSAKGTSTSVSSLLLGGGADLDELLSVVSGIFGSSWEEATQVAVVIPPGGWERKFADRFLSRMTRLTDLSVESLHDRVDSLFDSLGASKNRCPEFGRVSIYIAPEHFPNALRSIRRLVKQRSEDGIPLEAVEQTSLLPFAADIWNNLYDQWRIEDYLKSRDP